MNNQLMLASNDIVSIANAFFASGMFPDIKSGAQAIVKIQAGQEIGIPPFAAMTGIHIIQGKPTIGGGIMAARIKASGKYDYKLLEKSVTRCRIEFFEDGKSQGIEEFTIDQAKQAGTQNLAKFPANMLFNRCISNGLKGFCPDVFYSAVYTPEEFGAEDTTAEVTDTKQGGQQAVVMPITTKSSTTPGPTIIPKKVLLLDSEEYSKAIEFMKTGGTVDNLRVRYDIGPKQAVEMEERARLTSQEDIHKANAGYVPPTTAAAVDEPITSDPF